MMLVLRQLSIVSNDRSIAVPVEIELPTNDAGSWRCNYSIGWPDGTKHAYAMGYDSIQAIFIAMQMIAIDLYASPYHAARTLRWDQPEAGYGFPLSGARDQAIGDDRKL